MADHNGNTPLIEAVKNDRVDVVRLLLGRVVVTALIIFVDYVLVWRLL